LIFNKKVFNQNVNRWALGYKLRKHASIWQGYEVRPTLNHIFTVEQRLWQQLSLGFYPNECLHIVWRTRLEHRWVTHTSKISHRLRQRLLVKKDLPKYETIKAVVFDEIFFALNHPRWVSKNTISENRIFFGFDFYLSKKNFIRVGYMNRYLTEEKPKKLFFHLLWTSVHINI